MAPRGVPWPSRGVSWPLYEDHMLELSIMIYFSSRRMLDVCHTSTHGVALMRI